MTIDDSTAVSNPCAASAMKRFSRRLALATGSSLAWVIVIHAGGCGLLAAGGGSFDGDTEFSETTDIRCETSWFDDESGYGFDLPADAVFARSNHEQDALSNALWTLNAGGSLVNIATRVQMAAVDGSLAEIVRSFDDDALFAGASLLLEEPLTLAGGAEAFHSIIDFDGLTASRVVSLVDGRLYSVEVIVATDERDDELDAMIAAIVRSLCVG